VEDAASREDTKYSLGSVLNHVMLHQTVIGQEALEQLDLADAWPDVVVGCVGGGSNFAGLAFPFVQQKLAGKAVRVVAAEPAACPSLTRGEYRYDFGDTVGMTPLLKMHTLGHSFLPAGFHAGGLRYHGSAPLVSALLDQGLIEAVAVNQLPTFEAAITFARSEGIVPAPESAHAIRAAVDEAMAAREAGEDRTILFGLSGNGNLDLAAYQNYLAGNLMNYEHPQAAIEAALAELPEIAAD
jgi:tryptophan synthase beta chain